VRSRATDRGSWRLVTKREFWVRLRDRGFLISTAITVTVLSVFIIGNALAGGGSPSFRLAVAEADRPFADIAEQVAHDRKVSLTVSIVPDLAAAEQAVRSGAVNGAVVGSEFIVKTDAAPALEDVVAEANRRRAIGEQLQGRGLSPGEVDSILDPPKMGRRSLEPAPSTQRKVNSTVAFVALLLLYGQLFGYGVWVASGVVEEKSSRVVEVLLSAIRARQLMAGKVLGIGLLGLLQLSCIGAIAVTLSLVSGSLNVPGQALLTLGVTLFWFALGFGFYASLFAVAGALVSRMEELQNAIVPLNLTILGSFFISIAAVNDPDSTLARVASLVPFSAPFAMPPRIALGSATVPEAIASAVLLIGATALAIPFAGRLYAGAILRIGARVKLRDAWRAAR
jgi:ABC-2 type transport system permease protein